MLVSIRPYLPSDWDAIRQIHDTSRRIELKLAGLDEAFLPFQIAADREDFFSYPGIFVAEVSGKVVGFSACSEDELAWLYVDPNYMRIGIAKKLISHMFSQFPHICHVEVLAGNTPAKILYESIGFQQVDTAHGKMPGNENFPVTVYLYERI